MPSNRPMSPVAFTIEVTDSDLTALLGEVIASVDSPPVSNLVRHVRAGRVRGKRHDYDAVSR